MAEESSTQADQLASIPYEVIRDKTLNTHDHLFKLIIIGDSCKFRLLDRITFDFGDSRWKKLSVVASDGRRVQS